MEPHRIRVNLLITRRCWRQLRQLAAYEEQAQGKIIERLVQAEVTRLQQEHLDWVATPTAVG